MSNEVIERAVREWREDGVLHLDTLLALDAQGVDEEEIEHLATLDSVDE